MFEELGLEGWTPLAASVVFGLLIGVAFGSLAQRSRFCLRRGLVGPEAERSSALGTWLMALAVSIAGTTAASVYGFVDFSSHRLQSDSLPLAAIILGGLMFGVGMVLARGCASRLTVLAATGNLRALITILVFAVAAHATLKGVLAPARTWLGEFSIDLGQPATLAAMFGNAVIPAALLVALLLVVVLRSGASWAQLAMGALIGALIPIAWVGTGYILYDEFDPISLQGLAFTLPATETLFWTVAGTAIDPGFGVGFIGGVLAGSLLASVLFGDFRLVGFNRDTPTGNYLAGGLLMGVGGVLAGGCTIGAGLSGVGMLSIGAMFALASMIAGALLTSVALQRQTSGQASLVPAE